MEVEIERQGAEDRGLASGVGALHTGGIHRLDPLGIVGRETGEHDDADDGEHEACARGHQRREEHREQPEANHPEQSHHAERTDRAEVALGHKAETTQASKAKSSDAENLRDAGTRV